MNFRAAHEPDTARRLPFCMASLFPTLMRKDAFASWGWNWGIGSEGKEKLGAGFSTRNKFVITMTIMMIHCSMFRVHFYHRIHLNSSINASVSYLWNHVQHQGLCRYVSILVEEIYMLSFYCKFGICKNLVVYLS